MTDETKGSKVEKTEGDKPEVKVEPEVKAAVQKVNAEATAPKAKAPVKKKIAKKPAAKRAPVQKKIKAKAPAQKAAPSPKKKENTMGKMDINNWFAAFELPTADKVEELVADANKKGEEFIAKSKSATEELAELTKANIEAMVEAGKIATAGAKQIGEELVEDGRDGFEKASEAMKAFAEAKSPAEVMELQAKMVRENVDHMIAETSALTEQWVKLAGEAMQPVSNRASLNAEKIKAFMA
ncbi:phasin family protein [Sphingomicrobium clamense]|uniref:Phasin family protein n=1 Tax=Sphingomicrobium clamense TaxID=2851013 RepID=A0ABS6V8R7_9SPHN|nr:phasin family protein [Sphingomicrobium sp. B8]MBW0145745.1 phasin family protein [Sphingomicrobium sp. B8]